jgi:hypothetical protein
MLMRDYSAIAGFDMLLRMMPMFLSFIDYFAIAAADCH